ncbi:MAG: hypothetical protein LUM44_17780 [Pyrinomonadaceae bacterium]|nr:hypothetical protein [Pyrinomonadaceae bacterium]
MPKNEITFTQETELLSDDGFTPDTHGLNQLIIELKKCPKCKQKLVYKGFSNRTDFHNYGVCACGYWKLFWTEKTALSSRNAANLHAA